MDYKFLTSMNHLVTTPDTFSSKSTSSWVNGPVSVSGYGLSKRLLSLFERMVWGPKIQPAIFIGELNIVILSSEIKFDCGTLTFYCA